MSQSPMNEQESALHDALANDDFFGNDFSDDTATVQPSDESSQEDSQDNIQESIQKWNSIQESIRQEAEGIENPTEKKIILGLGDIIYQLDLNCETFKLMIKDMETYGACFAGGFIRDLALDREPKDLDVFVVNRDTPLDEVLSEDYGVLRPEDCISSAGNNPSESRVTCTKFSAPGGIRIVIDVIKYIHFANSTSNVTETFDFSVNMLRLAVDEDMKLCLVGNSQYSKEEILQHLETRTLKIGKYLWYRATVFRMITRWAKMVANLGFTADEATTRQYRNYVLERSGVKPAAAIYDENGPILEAVRKAEIEFMARSLSVPAAQILEKAEAICPNDNGKNDLEIL